VTVYIFSGSLLWESLNLLVTRHCGKKVGGGGRDQGEGRRRKGVVLGEAAAVLFCF
jgi:hypothetical protein